jgi:hypothetical protein
MFFVESKQPSPLRDDVPFRTGGPLARPLPGAATALAVVTFVSAAASSIATLAWTGAFPGPLPPAANTVLAEARGWCLVTLILVLPVALASLRRSIRGSVRGRLVWMGTLAYFVYTYLELAVSPPFTALYLLYVVSFACAIPALVMGVASVDVEALAAAVRGRAPRRAVAFFSLTFSALLALAWLRDIVGRTLAGDFGWPEHAAAVGHVVHALDLGLQVPLGVATGILLLRRRGSGYLAAAILLVNGGCMGAALTAMVAWSAAASGGSARTSLPFAAISLIAIALAIAFFLAVPAHAGAPARIPVRGSRRPGGREA